MLRSPETGWPTFATENDPFILLWWFILKNGGVFRFLLLLIEVFVLLGNVCGMTVFGVIVIESSWFEV